jgi:hypothetical protein
VERLTKNGIINSNTRFISFIILIFKWSKIAPLCISIEAVEVAFFVTGLETLQVLEVEMSTGGSTDSNVRSFEAILTIYLSIITRNI